MFPPVREIAVDTGHGVLPPSERKEYKPDTVEQVGKIVEDVPSNIVKRVRGQPTTVEVKETKEKEKQKPKRRLKSPQAQSESRSKGSESPPTPAPSPSATTNSQ